MQVENRRGVRSGPGDGRAVRMPGAGLVTRKVSAEQTGGAYSLFEVEVGPGEGEPPHVQHREDECLYVLEGLFEFLDDGGGSSKAGPGSLVYVTMGNLHRYSNVGETKGKLLVVHTPGASHESFVEAAGEPAFDEGASPMPERPQNPGRLALLAAEHGIEMVPPP